MEYDCAIINSLQVLDWHSVELWAGAETFGGSHLSLKPGPSAVLLLEAVDKARYWYKQ